MRVVELNSKPQKYVMSTQTHKYVTSTQPHKYVTFTQPHKYVTSTQPHKYVTSTQTRLLLERSLRTDIVCNLYTGIQVPTILRITFFIARFELSRWYVYVGSFGYK